MLLLNITEPFTATHADSGTDVVLARARGSWRISKTLLAEYADTAVVVDHNRVVGVYSIAGWHPDPDDGSRVIFDLVPDSDWQWLVGQDGPARWTRSKTRRVQRLGGIDVDELRRRRPGQVSRDGWNLEVAADGTTAVVSAPGALVVTALNQGALQVRLSDRLP